MKLRDIKTEADLAAKFIEYFADKYEIYKEVPTVGGCIDFVAVNPNFRIGVEVKTSLNFKVIEQAFYQRPFFNYTYIAVPGTKGSFALEICKTYGIGVLEYFQTGRRPGYNVSETVRPKINRTPRLITLAEYMKRSVAGSQNDRVTAFQFTVETFVARLRRERNNRMLLKTLIAEEKHHWSTNTTAKNCIYTWCRTGVITEFYIEDGYAILKKPQNDEFSRQNTLTL